MGGFNNAADATDVGTVAIVRVSLTPYDTRDRRQMDHPGDPSHRLAHLMRVAHVAKLAPRAAEVQPDRFPPPRFERWAQGTANQPFGTGDKDAPARGPTPSPRRRARRAVRQEVSTGSDSVPAIGRMIRHKPSLAHYGGQSQAFERESLSPSSRTASNPCRASARNASVVR